MRNLFLVLLLVNLGVLAWFSWVVPPPPTPAPYSGPGITLLRELPPDSPILAAARTPAVPSGTGAPATLEAAVSRLEDPAFTALPPGAPDSVPESAPATAVPPPDAVASCAAIGPFGDVGQAEVALATLGEAGIAATLTSRDEEVWDGYWVYVGGLADMPRANAVLAELAAGGIADAYVIPNSDSGILISLGVFSDISRAGTQAERAGRLGHPATISERMRTSQTHWLEIRLSGEDADAIGMLQEPGRIIRVEPLDCGAARAD